ncbi:MAG: Cof-type HAD-IIB family hydrolase [Lachnospiraceae bacterium]
MPSNILFTDLDGTLLRDNTKDVSTQMHLTLEALLAHGHKLVFTSGRPLNSILEVIDRLALRDASGHLTKEGLYISAFNGALLYDLAAGTALMEHRIPMKDVAYLTSQASLSEIYCHTYSDTHIITRWNAPELQAYRKHIHLPVLFSDPITDALEKEPFKLIAIDLHQKQALVRFRQSLLPWSEGRITPLFSNDRYLELFSCHAGKGNSLITLCQLLNIPIAHTMAAGDADNDLSMIEAAGVGVAMSNASDLVKAHADLITVHDNNQDGLLPVIKEFFAL